LTGPDGCDARVAAWASFANKPVPALSPTMAAAAVSAAVTVLRMRRVVVFIGFSQVFVLLN
jgi:hypothetical protein